MSLQRWKTELNIHTSMANYLGGEKNLIIIIYLW